MILSRCKLTASRLHSGSWDGKSIVVHGSTDLELVGLMLEDEEIGGCGPIAHKELRDGFVRVQFENVAGIQTTCDQSMVGACMIHVHVYCVCVCVRFIHVHVPRYTL